MQIVQADQQRLIHGSRLQKRLDVLQQPEPLLGCAVNVSQRCSVEQRWVVLEECLKHRSHLDNPVERVRHAVPPADPHVKPACEHLTEQPGLAEARSTLDDDHRAHAVGQTIQAALQEGDLGVSAPQHRGCEHGVVT